MKVCIKVSALRWSADAISTFGPPLQMRAKATAVFRLKRRKPVVMLVPRITHWLPAAMPSASADRRLARM